MNTALTQTELWAAINSRILKRLLLNQKQWWNKWKTVIFQIIEMSPAEPTNYKKETK